MVAPFWMFLAPCSSLTLTMFGREIRHCFEVCLLGVFGMVSYWGRSRVVMCLVSFIDNDGHLFWDCTFPPLVEIRENPEFHELMEMDKSCLAWVLALAWMATCALWC